MLLLLLYAAPRLMAVASNTQSVSGCLTVNADYFRTTSCCASRCLLHRPRAKKDVVATVIAAAYAAFAAYATAYAATATAVILFKPDHSVVSCRCRCHILITATALHTSRLITTNNTTNSTTNTISSSTTTTSSSTTTTTTTTTSSRLSK